MISSSSAQTYALGSLNYLWDTVTGFLFTANALGFFIIMIIIFGVIGLAFGLIRGVFRR